MTTIQSVAYEASTPLPQEDLSFYGISEEKLGEGTFGSVYRMSSGVVLKLLTGDDDKPADGPIEREVAITLNLHHPNVVHIIDVVWIENDVGIILPLADMDLKMAIVANLFNKQQKTKIAYQLISGLAYCFCRDVLNRDIKPENILVFNPSDDSLHVEIADLGLARQFNCSTDGGVTRGMFTLWYRPPEVILGGQYNKLADIWALGCVLFQLFTGFPLYPGESPEKVLRLIYDDQGLSIDTFPGIVNYPEWPKISEQLSSVKKKYPDYSKNSLVKLHEKDEIDPEMLTIIIGMITPNPYQRPNPQSLLEFSYFNQYRRPDDQIPLICSCHDAMKTKEIYPILEYGKNTGEITMTVREIMFSWLFEIKIEYDLSFACLFLCYYLVDSFTIISSIQRKDYQMIGAVSLMIASGLLNTTELKLEDCAVMTDDAYSIEEFKATEKDILSDLDWNISVSTSLNFLVELSRFYPESVLRISTAVLTFSSIIGVMQGIPCLPSQLAAACTIIACRYKDVVFKHMILLEDADINKLVGGILEAMSVGTPVEPVDKWLQGTTIAEIARQANKTKLKTSLTSSTRSKSVA
jgi:CTD kinase subunit alpha